MTNRQNRVNFTRKLTLLKIYRSGLPSYLVAPGVAAGAVLVGAAALLQAFLWRRCPILLCLVVVDLVVEVVVDVLVSVPAAGA